jgi:hypothetical protein
LEVAGPDEPVLVADDWLVEEAPEEVTLLPALAELERSVTLEARLEARELAPETALLMIEPWAAARAAKVPTKTAENFILVFLVSIDETSWASGRLGG